MPFLDTIPVGDIVAALAKIAADADTVRGIAGVVVWRWFDARRDEPIPGIPRFPFGLKQPRIGQLRALIEKEFGPHPPPPLPEVVPGIESILLPGARL